MKILVLVYDPRNWKQPGSLPADFVYADEKHLDKFARLTGYPPGHITLTIWGDEAGTKTLGTVSGLKIALDTFGPGPS